MADPVLNATDGNGLPIYTTLADLIGKLEAGEIVRLSGGTGDVPNVVVLSYLAGEASRMVDTALARGRYVTPLAKSVPVAPATEGYYLPEIVRITTLVTLKGLWSYRVNTTTPGTLAEEWNKAEKELERIANCSLVLPLDRVSASGEAKVVSVPRSDFAGSVSPGLTPWWMQ